MVFTRKDGDFHGLCLLVSGRVGSIHFCLCQYHPARQHCFKIQDHLFGPYGGGTGFGTNDGGEWTIRFDHGEDRCLERSDLERGPQVTISTS